MRGSGGWNQKWDKTNFGKCLSDAEWDEGRSHFCLLGRQILKRRSLGSIATNPPRIRKFLC